MAPRKKKESSADPCVSSGDVVSAPSVFALPSSSGVFQNVAIKDIVIPPNIRSSINEELFNALVENVRVNGIIEPLIVNHDPYSNSLELVSGFRRLNAAVVLSHKTVPCIVHENLSMRDIHHFMISENLMREDLDPISEAFGIQRLIDDGVKQDVIAAELGKAQPFVSNRVRLLGLHPDIRARIISREINPSTGLEILAEISKIRAVSVLTDSDDFISIVSTVFAKNKSNDDVYDFRCVCSERALSLFKKSVVNDPRCKLGYGPECAVCRDCPKLYRDLCFDVECFSAREKTMKERLKIPSKPVKKEISAEEKLNSENLTKFFSEIREKVAVLSADRKLDLLVKMFYRRSDHRELERSYKLVYDVKKFEKDSVVSQFDQVDKMLPMCILSACCAVYSMKDVRIIPSALADFVDDVGLSFSDDLMTSSGASAVLDKLNSSASDVVTTSSSSLDNASDVSEALSDDKPEVLICELCGGSGPLSYSSELDCMLCSECLEDNTDFDEDD